MHFCTPTKYLLFTVIVLSFLLNGAQAVCSKYPPEKSTYINVNNPEKSTCINFEVVNQPTGSGQYAAQTSGVYQSGPNNEKNLFNAFDGNENTGYTVQDFNYKSCTNGLCSYSGASPVPNNGDWIQLTLPHPITLTGFFLSGSPTRMATAGNVQGSNDDFKTSYTIIGYFGYQTTPQSTLTVPMASSIPYKSYRLVVSRVGSGDILSIASFYLIGCDASPTYSPTLAPTTYSPSSVPTATPSSVFPSTSLQRRETIMAKLIETGNMLRSIYIQAMKSLSSWSSSLMTITYSTGEKDKLKEMLRERLVQCGWRDELKEYCKEVIRKKGLEKVTVEELVADITPQGRATVPEDIKAELLKRIRVFLQST